MPILLLLLLAHSAAGGEWQTLFDGRSTSAFISINGGPFPEHWVVRDGCLCSLPANAGRQDLRTTAEYEAFELEWEWRTPPKGNSGVKYLLERVDEWAHPEGLGRHARARGAEYQLGDDSIFPQPERRAGALYGRAAPSAAAARPPGEWNQSRIVVKPTGEVEHWLNGQRVVAYNAALRRSAVSLQHHNTEVCFRAVRIRPLN